MKLSDEIERLDEFVVALDCLHGVSLPHGLNIKLYNIRGESKAVLIEKQEQQKEHDTRDHS